MSGLKAFREKYPQYQAVPDDALADGLYRKFYADKMDRATFDQRMGFGQAQPPAAAAAPQVQPQAPSPAQPVRPPDPQGVQVPDPRVAPSTRPAPAWETEAPPQLSAPQQQPAQPAQPRVVFPDPNAPRVPQPTSVADTEQMQAPYEPAPIRQDQTPNTRVGLDSVHPPAPGGESGLIEQGKRGFQTGVTGAKQMGVAAAMVPFAEGIRFANEQMQLMDQIDAGTWNRSQYPSTAAIPANVLRYANADQAGRKQIRDQLVTGIASNRETLQPLFDAWQAYGAEMQGTQGRVPNFTDIRDVEAFNDWLAFNVGQGIPYIGATMIAALLGGAPGALAMGYGMGVGDTMTAQMDAGVAPEDAAAVSMVAGVPYAALELLGPAGRIVRNSIGRGLTEGALTQVARGYFARLGREVPANFVEEFINEAGQEIINSATVSYQTREPLITDENLLNWFNAGMAGGATGAVTSGVTAAFPGGDAPSPLPRPTPDQAEPPPPEDTGPRLPGRDDLRTMLNDPRPVDEIRAEQEQASVTPRAPDEPAPPQVIPPPAPAAAAPPAPAPQGQTPGRYVITYPDGEVVTGRLDSVVRGEDGEMLQRVIRDDGQVDLIAPGEAQFAPVPQGGATVQDSFTVAPPAPPIPTPPVQGGQVAFVPTTEWQEVPQGAVVPPGLEIRMDQTTGKTTARLMQGTGTRQDPVKAETAEAVDVAAAQAAEPTEGQKEAGNYAKGHIKVQGLDISIENPQGSTRSGVDPDGQPWSVEMPAHYGYIKRTEGADGEQVDVYIGADPQAQTVYVIDQIDPETGEFDEHKVMIGFPDGGRAMRAYRSAFSDGRGAERAGAVTELTIDQFKEWIRNGNGKKPFRYIDQTEQRRNEQRLAQEQAHRLAETRKQNVEAVRKMFPADHIVNLRGDNIEVFDASGNGLASGMAGDLKWWEGVAKQTAAKAGQRKPAPAPSVDAAPSVDTLPPDVPGDSGLYKEPTRLQFSLSRKLDEAEYAKQMVYSLKDLERGRGKPVTTRGGAVIRSSRDASPWLDRFSAYRGYVNKEFVDAVNADPTLAARGITAKANGDDVYVMGVGGQSGRAALSDDREGYIRAALQGQPTAPAPAAEPPPAATATQSGAPGGMDAQDAPQGWRDLTPAGREQAARMIGLTPAQAKRTSLMNWQNVNPAIKDALVKNEFRTEGPKQEQPKGTLIGENFDGNVLFEDERGVRYFVRDGIRVTEPVQMAPNGAVIRPTNERRLSSGRDNFLTVKEMRSMTAGNVEPEAPTVAQAQDTDGSPLGPRVNVNRVGSDGMTDQEREAAAIRNGQVPVMDDRERQRRENVRKMQEQDGQQDELDAEMRSYESKAEQRAAQAPNADYGKTNTVFTEDAAAKARELLRRKLSGNQLNSGLDPEIVQAGITLAGYHIEAGARSFAAYSRAMADDLGDGVTPYLRTWYEAVRYYPGFDAAGMTSAADIDAGRTGEAQPARDTMQADTTEGQTDGVQKPVPPRDAGPRAEDAEQPGSVETDRRPPGRKEPGSAPDVRGPDEGAPGQGRGDAASRPPRGRGNREGDADRVPGRSDAERVVGENYVFDETDLGIDRPWSQKARDNLAAIKMVKTLEAEGRPATAEEQRALVKYVGWGATEIKDVFEADPDKIKSRNLREIAKDLRDTLTEVEFDTARRTTQYAHYTSPTVIKAMYDASARLGFKGGVVFEPGMGIGHFLGMMPADMAARSQYSGLEMDHMTQRIAALLYPKAGVRLGDFREAPLPKDYFDLVIGNPPFADIAVQRDPNYPQKFLLHDYFFAKSLDSVRPGGLMMFISSAGTMNKIDDQARQYLADRADLVGAIRLPGNAFDKNAGTQVTTDVIILRKRMPGERAGNNAWVSVGRITGPDKNGKPTEGNSNRYFIDNPDMVIGEEGFFDPPYENRYAVRMPSGMDFAAELSRAVERLPENVMAAPETMADRAEVDFGTAERKEGSFYVSGDKLLQVVSGVGVEAQPRGKGVKGGRTKAEMDRIRKLIPIRDALRAVYAADLENDTGNGEKARARLNAAYDAFVAEFGPINKVNFQYRRPTIIQQETARAQAREMARERGEPWNEGSFDASDFYRRGAKASEIAKARQEAREAAGDAFDEGSFNPAEMGDVVIEKRPNVDPFMEDPESYRLRSIEHHNDQTGEARKGEIFRRNILTREPEKRINSPQDAVLWSLGRFGRLDLKAMAAELGQTEATLIEALGDRVYRVPGTDDTWQTSDEYLSGDVHKKLRIAKRWADKDPAFRRNVDALEAALPDPLPPSEITMALGMRWIPVETIKEFALQKLGLDSFTIIYNSKLATYSVSGDDYSAASTAEWGTDKMAAPDIIEHALNRRQPRVTYKTQDGNTVVDAEATQAANDKLKNIKEAFQAWVAEDTARHEALAEVYNDAYNGIVVPDYDGSWLTTPGIADGWSWRPHQKRVVARIIQNGNTYMAHAVGAGKTSAMIGAGMEMRRLGLVKKPMYVVPNHMLGQFTKEFYEQYPTARIAVADEFRFHTDRRKQFIADVAQQDIDAIIITHSAANLIPVSDTFQDTIVQEEIDLYREAMKEAKADKEGSRYTVKRIEKQIERLEERLSRKGRTDQVFTFEEMGVDFMFVDEAHLFRKLSFATQMGSIKGVDPNGSDMALNLYMKTRYLNTVRPGRNLVLASGTPITNTMAELFTLQRFIQPQVLDERSLSRFDAWAANFGDQKAELESDPAGNYKSVTRFSQFVNAFDLYRMVALNMDIVTSAELDQYVSRPKLIGGSRKLVQVERSKELEEYQAELAERMAAIAQRSGPPKPGDDIILNVINDGRKAAIDMRLVKPGIDVSSKSKLDVMVDNVFSIWKETRNKPFYNLATGEKVDTGPATQMVFANLGVTELGDGGSQGFSTHRYIKQELVRRGVPEAEVALIQNFKSHTARQRLFNDMNEGRVRVLIGTTAKMGTGVNAQRRLYAVHNEDALWYPADDEQRNGRIIRQGNQNQEIRILDYATTGTYDATMWGMMARKARFIEQFFRGDPSLREMEDLGEASHYEQARALSTADPRLIELTEKKEKMIALRRKASAHSSQQYSIKNKIVRAEAVIRDRTATIKKTKADLAQRVDTKGEAFFAVVDGQRIEDRADAGAAMVDRLNAAIDRMQEGKGPNEVRVTLGEIGGFPVVAEVYRSGPEKIGFGIELKRNGDRGTTVKYGGSAAGMIQSVESALRGFEAEVEAFTGDIARAEREIAEFTPKLGRPFEQAGDLARLEDEVDTLEAELQAAADATQPSAAVIEEYPGDGEPSGPTSDDVPFMSARLRVADTAEPTQRVRNNMARVRRAVRAELDRLGLGDIAVSFDITSLPDGDKALAAYWRRTVYFALDNPDPVDSLNHEVIHAVKRLGLLTPQEWRVLERAATDRDWLQRFGIDRGYSDLSQEARIEEAIAEAARAHRAGDLGLKGPIGRALERLLRVIEAIRNAFAGLGFTTAEDVFGKVSSGEVGQRQREDRAQSGPAFQVRPEDAAAAVDEASDALDKATAEDVPVRGADRLYVRDIGTMKRLFVHPRMIASMHREFVNVFLAAKEQFQARDQMAAEIAFATKPYFDLPIESKAKVNAVLELARLMKSSFPKDRVREIVNADQPDAQLSKPGQVLRLNDAEAEAYAAVRKAMNMALDFFKAQTIEDGGLDPEQFKSANDITAALANQTDEAKREKMTELARRVREIEQAKRQGYVPFTRYGQIGIAVKRKEVDPETGEQETLYFEMVEIDGITERVKRILAQGDANKLGGIPAVAKALAAVKAKFKDNADDVDISVFQIPAKGGPTATDKVSLSAVDALAEMARIEPSVWERIRESLEKASKGKGFRAHFIRAKDVPGYSTDFERGISDYIIGISGYLSRIKTNSKWDRGIASIPGTMPKLREYAQKYRDYVQTPQEEYQMWRQGMFMMYIAGRVSTALVNLTQVPMFTAPYLHQFAGHAAVARELARAYKDAAKMVSVKQGLDLVDPDKAPPDLRDAVRDAIERGVLVPLETYEIMGQAQNRAPVLRGVSKDLQNAMQLVAIMFTAAERMNRLVTYIAAHRLARNAATRKAIRETLAKNPLARSRELLAGFTPEKFAEWVIDETHFLMGKQNRPTIMRGNMAPVTQFKGFVFQSLELMWRVAFQNGKRGKIAFGLMLLMILMTSGYEELPFTEDVMAVISALWRRITHEDLDVALELREAIAEGMKATFSLAGMTDQDAQRAGAKAAEVAARGLSRLGPFDLSGKTGFGTVVDPGAQGVEQLLGIPYDFLVNRPSRFIEAAAREDYPEAVGAFSPQFINDLIVSAVWANEGVKNQSLGRVVIPAEDLTSTDIAMRSIGFIPSRVAAMREGIYRARRAQQANSDIRSTFYTRMGRAVADRIRASQMAAGAEGDVGTAMKARQAMDEATARIEALRQEIADYNAGKSNDQKIILHEPSLRQVVRQELDGALSRRARRQSRERTQEIHDLYFGPYQVDPMGEPASPIPIQ